MSEMGIVQRVTLLLLAICLTMVILLGSVVLVQLLMGDTAAMVLGVVYVIALVGVGMWALFKSASGLFISHSRNTLQGVAMVQASDDRSELLKRALELTRLQTTPANRGLLEALRNEAGALNAAANGQPVKEDLSWLDMSPSRFVETE